MAYNAQDKQDLLFIYDLPKDKYTSVKLSEAFKEQVGFPLEKIPQVKRDTTRPHYSCIVKIEDTEKFRKAVDGMKYFEIDGKQCRALPFDKDLLGMNKQNLVDHNVFVKRIPKEMTMAQLHEHVSKVGDVKSLKISLNEDHSSRTYGFICFQDKESASKAISQGLGTDGEIELLKYEPKDRRDNRKAFNNIYCKNFPDSWSEDQVKELFAPYGKIHSCVVQKNDKGAYAFVCFGHEEGSDPTIAAESASKAVQELNGRDMGSDLKLYCREALKKADRELEKTREMLRYKNSKKRCNLYIKNFDPSMGEEELIAKFKDYGEIEKVKMFKDEKQKNVYAFVCYKTPDAATNAKNALNRTTLGDRQLYINHYEIKELRKVQNETMEDNADFQKYLNKNSGGAQISDTINTQNLYTILTSLLANPRLSSSLFHQAPKSGPQFRQGGPMNQHQRAQGRIPMPHANHMQNPMQMMQQQQQFM
jgi:RNA recognition motif-containing protein